MAVSEQEFVMLLEEAGAKDLNDLEDLFWDPEAADVFALLSYRASNVFSILAIGDLVGAG